MSIAPAVQPRTDLVEREHEMPSHGKPVRVSVVSGPSLNRPKSRAVVGAITAGDLVERYIIPRRDHLQKVGYQREPAQSRIKQLAREMTEKRVDLPTAILVNIREGSTERNLVETEDGLVLLLGDERLYVVDGQHRVLALERLVSQDPDKWRPFLLAFVCMLGADEHEEMEQFYIVNSTAKSVRTDLALDLLKQRAESDQSIMEGLVERGQDWKVRAQTLAEELAKTPHWVGRIRFPLDAAATTTIASSGVVSSLKRPLSTPYFGTITTENQTKILKAYWQAVATVLPDAFNEPSEFALQKSIGTMAMHAMLVPVLERLRANGASVIDPDSYINILQEPLTELEGENLGGAPVRGADFWRSAPRGAAGSYSSSAGQRVLIAKLNALLPQLEVT